MRANVRWIVVAMGAALGGCGGAYGSSGSSSAGRCTPTQTADVEVTSGGFSPRAVCVVPTGSVTITNGDAVDHDIESGMTCAQLNLGPIPAGEARTATFPTTQTCAFFDAAHSDEAAFQGTVAVSSAPTTGPGY